MRRDILDISKFVYHVELGEDGQRLEPDAERPQEVNRIQRFMSDYGHQKSSAVEIVVREDISLAVQAERIGSFESHEVYSVAGQRDEHDFHYKGIEGLPAEEEIDVAGEEDDKEQLLCAV